MLRRKFRKEFRKSIRAFRVGHDNFNASRIHILPSQTLQTELETLQVFEAGYEYGNAGLVMFAAQHTGTRKNNIQDLLGTEFGSVKMFHNSRCALGDVRKFISVRCQFPQEFGQFLDRR